MKKLFSLLVVSILVLTGCGGNSDKVNIGFSISTLDNPFFTTMSDAAKDKAKELDVDVNVVDAQNDSAKQMTDIEDLVTQGADVVIINPVDSDSIGTSVQTLNEKDIPVITVDRAASSGEVVSHIASDNTLGGKIAGEYALELLNNTGDIAILEGVPGASATIERGTGFEDAVKGKLNIVEKQTANFDRAEALKVTEDIVNANPSIKLIFAHNDEMALGAQEALRGLNREDIIVLGFDATDDAIASIKDGGMEATVEQQPALMGEMAIETAHKVANGEEVEASIPEEVKLVNKDTL
ncbi:MAG: D-ribose ABC transporter substrate-binding protein [Mycoplasmatales bacterium]